jgi:GTP-binding protein
MMTATKGSAIINSEAAGYDEWAGEIPGREQGSMIAHENGRVTAYACEQAQERGSLFVGPNDYVYEGQVVGQNSRPDDLKINVAKQKELTNFRAAGSDKHEGLTPKKDMSLDDCIEYIANDELVELTPKEVRMLKNPKAEKKKKKDKK